MLNFIEKRVRLSREGFAARARDDPTGTEGNAAATGEGVTSTGDDAKVCLGVSFPTVGSCLALLFGVLPPLRGTIADAHSWPPLFSRTFCLHCFLVKPRGIDVGSDTEFSDSTTAPPSPSSSRGDATPDDTTNTGGDTQVCIWNVVSSRGTVMCVLCGVTGIAGDTIKY